VYQNSKSRNLSKYFAPKILLFFFKFFTFIMDLSAYEENNGDNLVLFSPIPDVCKREPCALGIDEAGRGPVLGPMVYACAYCPESWKADLKDLGVDDSKALKESERESLLDKLLANDQRVGWGIHVLSPRYISRSMYRRAKHNLNSISHDAAAGLIRKALDDGVRVTEVFVDTVGPPDKYQAKLQALFPALSITVAKKADSLYPVVSAASICAKVARDRVVRSWKHAEGQEGDFGECGSGYPGDAVTKKFLQDHLDPLFGFPSMVRFSWKTAEKIIDEQCLLMQFEEVEPEEEESVKRNPSVKEYFVVAPKKKSATPATRTGIKKSKWQVHPYYTERCLKIGHLF